jgi:hypothetical protein
METDEEGFFGRPHLMQFNATVMSYYFTAVTSLIKFWEPLAVTKA